MKLLKEVENIINKNEFKPIEIPAGFANLYRYKDNNPEDYTYYYNIVKNDSYFIKKYRKHIPQGWYGFSMGAPIIPQWLDIVDEVLELCIKNDPEFEIHQIKIKFGGVRFYVHSGVIEDIFEIESVIENKLFDKALIY